MLDVNHTNVFENVTLDIQSGANGLDGFNKYVIVIHEHLFTSVNRAWHHSFIDIWKETSMEAHPLLSYLYQ